MAASGAVSAGISLGLIYSTAGQNLIKQILLQAREQKQLSALLPFSGLVYEDNLEAAVRRSEHVN